jgi:hypothetical protein
MKTTLLAALICAAIALPAFGQATTKESAKIQAGEAGVQAKDRAQATPKEGAKLAKAQNKKSRKAAKPKREAKAAG